MTSKSPRRKWPFAVAALLVVLTASFAVLLYVTAKDRLTRPFSAYVNDVTVTFDSGGSASQILTELEQLGVLEDARLTRLYLIHQLGDPPLQAGEYSFDQPLSATAVLDRLIRGDVTTYPLVIIEGLAYFEIAESIASQGFGDQVVFRELMEQTELIRDLDPEATTLEGYLFPDTYAFSKGISEQRIVEKLVSTFRSNWQALQQEMPEDDPKVVMRPLRELVTLASIVEKEAVLDNERPVIAGVYHNRLLRPMTLGADPTLIYGLKLQGTWDGNLRRRDLRTDGPYNSYLRTGLPPGPICSPGKKSLAAALAPAATDFYYFVSRNDGSHVFARTLKEHNRNVEHWQKAYWRKKWAAERSAR